MLARRICAVLVAGGCATGVAAVPAHAAGPTDCGRVVVRTSPATKERVGGALQVRGATCRVAKVSIRRIVPLMANNTERQVEVGAYGWFCETGTRLVTCAGVRPGASRQRMSLRFRIAAR